MGWYQKFVFWSYMLPILITNGQIEPESIRSKNNTSTASAKASYFDRDSACTSTYVRKIAFSVIKNRIFDTHTLTIFSSTTRSQSISKIWYFSYCPHCHFSYQKLMFDIKIMYFWISIDSVFHSTIQSIIYYEILLWFIVYDRLN